MTIVLGAVVGFVAWFLVRYLVAGLFTVDQNERAVKTSFGRAQRLGDATTLDDPIAETLDGRREGALRLSAGAGHPAGRAYFKWPWEQVHKVSIATETMNMAFDPEDPEGEPAAARSWRRSRRTSSTPA